MDNLYDLVIIGLGPAAMTAGVYASRYNLKVLVVGGIPGGLMTESHKICNWPGEPNVVGTELSQKMFKQLKDQEVKIVFDEVSEIKGTQGDFTINTRGNKTFQGKFILMAMGTKHRHLDVPGEEEFAGRGVAYCATCDAMFFKGKTTAVVGSGNSAIGAALYLSEICPIVYLIFRGKELKCEAAWIADAEKRPNIVLVSDNNITKFIGAEKLEKVILDKPFNNQTELETAGVFIEIGSAPRNELFLSLGGEVDHHGYIKVNADMSTNVLGVFASGDLTNGSNGFRQITTAVAEGAIAADGIFKALKR